MKKAIAAILAASMICILLTGCATGEAIGNTVLVNAMGRWEEKTYTNDYFDFSVTIPQQWTAYTDAQMQQLIDAQNAAAAGDNAQLLRQAEQAKAWTANLFLASSSAFGQQANASVSMTAQMLGAFGNVFASTEEDYLALLLGATKMPAQTATFSPVSLVKLGNADFATSKIDVQVAGIDVTREIYTKAIDGYLLIINAVYTDDAGKKDIDTLLQTMKVE